MDKLDRAVSRWFSVGIKTDAFWTDRDLQIVFENTEIFLTQETEFTLPTASVDVANHNLTDDQAQDLLQRFLSAASWATKSGIEPFYPIFSRRIHPAPKPSKGKHVSLRFDLPYLPNPTDDKAKLALALYRDALSLNSVAYKFLGLARILNILGKSSFQKTWMNENLNLVRSPDAKAVIEALKDKVDIGDHLYRFGRSAVAHAEDQVVHPDKPEDLKRMRFELPLMRELAEIFIEKELHVKTQRTIYQEHLYELAGFKELLGSELIDKIKASDADTFDLLHLKNGFRIRIKDKKPFEGLEYLSALDASIYNGSVHMLLGSPKRLVGFYLGLDFRNERLQIWPEEIQYADDGSPAAAIEIQSCFRFLQDLFSNGEILVYNADNEKLLGRTDPYIPLNMDLGASIRSLKETQEYWQMQFDTRNQTGS